MNFKFSRVLLTALFVTNILSISIILKLRLQNKSDVNSTVYQNMIERKKKELEIGNMKFRCLQQINQNGKFSLVYYFSTKTCQPCFEICLDILNRSVLRKNVFVISFFENRNMQLFFQNKYPNLKILEGSLLCGKDTVFIDFVTSCFFEVDNSGNVYNAFVPDKNYPDLIKLYVNSVQIETKQTTETF